MLEYLQHLYCNVIKAYIKRKITVEIWMSREAAKQELITWSSMSDKTIEK